MSEPVRWAIPAVLLMSLLGTPLMLWWERRRPSSYSQRPDVLASWRESSTTAQEAFDTAAIDAAQSAENAAQAVVENAARTNVLYRS